MIGGYAPPSTVFIVAAAASIILVGALGIMGALHCRRLRRIPVRIHIAGTRGKSATTRLIAAGLRAGGLRVLAKTTGTLPRLILPDGSERPWPRWGPASIREQARLVALAARIGVDALVVECMAIHPELQWASERYFVRATIGVITNTRPDHLEQIGPDPAAALTAVVPRRAILYLTDESAEPAILERARALGTETRIVGAPARPPLAANRALALAVCQALAVPPSIAGVGMDRAPGDPGAFSVDWIEVAGKRVRFANAFACNDARSVELLWRETQPEAAGFAVVLLNARQDRPLRTRQLLGFLARCHPPVTLFLAQGGWLAARLARAAGFGGERLRRLPTREARRALEILAAAAEPGATIWGVGNYRGLGARITEATRGEAARC